MNQEWVYVVGVLAGLGAMALLFFLWNLAAAPYRFQRETCAALRVTADQLAEAAGLMKAQIAERDSTISELRDQRPRLSLMPQSIGYGDNEDMLVFCFFIRVSNAGGRSSSADGWQMNVRFAGPDNETRIPLELWASGTGFTMSSVSGEVVTVPETEYIFNKLVDPLQPGAMIVGALVGACKKGARDSKLAMLEASCVDVLGQTISCEHHVTFDHHDGFRFNPFVKATLGKA